MMQCKLGRKSALPKLLDTMRRGFPCLTSQPSGKGHVGSAAMRLRQQRLVGRQETLKAARYLGMRLVETLEARQKVHTMWHCHCLGESKSKDEARQMKHRNRGGLPTANLGTRSE